MRKFVFRAAGVSAALLLLHCDADPPVYDVQPPVLRLIADQTNVGPEGGFVFVVVELTPTDGGREPRSVFVRAEGASSLSLPGPSFCAPPDGGTEEPVPADGGADGSADAGTQKGPDGGVLASGPTELVFPYVAFRHNEARHTDETGVLVRIPAGTTDVALLAAAYDAPSDESCVIPNSQLEAMAFLRITRTTPSGQADAGRDGGTTDAGADADSDAGSDGGVDGGSDAGTDGGADSGTDGGGGQDAGTDGGDAG
ncbi:hypothetical protein ACQKGO_26495 [Corallococcus interemptor]|uniref:hypothetical protein n=1 Tax=Corallococcus interemptor TaxID=2316720 RepID=UPI003D06A4CA